MPWRRSQAAPYGSVRAFLRFLREAGKRGWPAVVDHAFLEQMGLRGGSAWEVLIALRFFGLVDAATDRPLERYRLLFAPWTEVQDALWKAIHNAYSEALGEERWWEQAQDDLARRCSERYGKVLARRRAAFALGLATALGKRRGPVDRRRRYWEGAGEEGEGGHGEWSGRKKDREQVVANRREAVRQAVKEGEQGQEDREAREGQMRGEPALPAKDLYLQVLIRRLERADAREAERLARRIESLLDMGPAPSRMLRRLLDDLLPWRRGGGSRR